jgi:hypothetical protein
MEEGGGLTINFTGRGIFTAGNDIAVFIKFIFTAL